MSEVFLVGKEGDALGRHGELPAEGNCSVVESHAEIALLPWNFIQTSRVFARC